MDAYLFEKINQFAGRWFWLDRLGVFFAKYFEYVLLFLLLALLAANLKKYWKMVIEAIVASVFARFVVVDIIRWIWYRPRPFVEQGVNMLFSYEAKAAFPSGHAAFYFALAAVVFLYNRRLGIVFLVAASLISLARVFAGIHWPADILAGAVVGIFSGILVYKLFGSHKKAL